MTSKKLFYTAIFICIFQLMALDGMTQLYWSNQWVLPDLFIGYMKMTKWVVPVMMLVVLFSGYWKGVRIFTITCALITLLGGTGIFFESALLDSALMLLWAGFAHTVQVLTARTSLEILPQSTLEMASLPLHSPDRK